MTSPLRYHNDMGIYRGYKDYIIDVQPYSLKVGGWSYELLLNKDDRGSVVTTIFFGNHAFPTEDDAIQSALDAARKKIDSGFEPQHEQEHENDL
jgi:hypothetical protein